MSLVKCDACGSEWFKQISVIQVDDAQSFNPVKQIRASNLLHMIECTVCKRVIVPDMAYSGFDQPLAAIVQKFMEDSEAATKRLEVAAKKDK